MDDKEWIGKVISSWHGVKSALDDAEEIITNGLEKFRSGYEGDGDGYGSLQEALDDAEDQLFEMLDRLREKSYGGGERRSRAGA